FCSISFNIGRLLISFLMRTPPFLFSGEKLLYQRRESSSYFLEIEGIFQLCPRKYFTHTFVYRQHIIFMIFCEASFSVPRSISSLALPIIMENKQQSWI